MIRALLLLLWLLKSLLKLLFLPIKLIYKFIKWLIERNQNKNK